MKPWSGPHLALLALLLPGALVAPVLAAALGAQTLETGAGAADSVRARIEALAFPPLHFDPPPVRETELLGVPVFHLEDSTLPLVDILARFDGGYAHFGRDNYAAATALPGFLRNGGTRALPPDSVEARVESLAMQMSFGSGGGAISASLNALTSTLDPAAELWWAMVTAPRFDTAVVEVWRGRQLEAVRRSADDPTSLAYGEFNRIVYGDHPIGWELAPADLTADALATARLQALHARIVCRDNLSLGVAGDLPWTEVEPRLRALIERVPPCPAPLPERPLPTVREAGGVFLLPRPLEQSTVIAAHSTDLVQADDPEWFASRVGNSILGTGGLSSRLMSRLRTEEGLVYGVSSLWTTPRDYPGLVGATTRTAPGTTVTALRLALELLGEMAADGPTATEVEETVSESVNGFVFAFDAPATVVARRMTYRAIGLPPDWLERTVAGYRTVTPEAIRGVFAEHLDLDRMTVLVVGDPERMEASLESLGLGPVVIVESPTPSAPSGSQRSRR